MTTTIKKVIAVCATLIVLTWVIFSIAANAAEKTLNYDVLKHHTKDVSMANDYFNKPAKVVEKNGQQYIQLTVNHSHWIVNFTFNGHKETIVSEDKAKDERTSEFPITQTSGETAGTIKVFIDEEVNGKPFKYDHNYNITYLLKGEGKNKAAVSPSGADTQKGEPATADKGASEKTAASEKTPANPETGAGESLWLYIAVIGGACLLVISLFINQRLRAGRK